MAKLAVVKCGGKQYVVGVGDELVIDKLPDQVNDTITLETLAVIDAEKDEIELGAPVLKAKTEAQIIEHGKGEKVRVARFKAKVRYRKVKGFRPQLTKIKILKV